MAKIYLEVPVFSPSSAEFIITQAEHGGGGIARLELNAKGSYGQGGTTPDPNTYRHAATAAAAAAAGLNNQTPTPLRVMIRPRGPPPGAGGDGSPDFVYSEAELDGMEEAIREWRVCGLMDEERGDGFVLGVLQVREEEEGEEGGDDGGRKRMRVDVGRNRRLVDVAAPFPCVFHRAFVSLLQVILASLTGSLGLFLFFLRLVLVYSKEALMNLSFIEHDDPVRGRIAHVSEKKHSFTHKHITDRLIFLFFPLTCRTTYSAAPAQL